MWYYTVHTPIMPNKAKLEKYRKKAKAMGLDIQDKRKDGIKDHQSMSRSVQSNESYACMVESMDENIGRILETLKRLKLEQDTIVVFLSDNGGLSTGPGPNYANIEPATAYWQSMAL